MSAAAPTASRRASAEVPSDRPTSESRTNPPTKAHVIPRSIPAAMVQITPPTRTGCGTASPTVMYRPSVDFDERDDGRPDRSEEEAHETAIGPRRDAMPRANLSLRGDERSALPRRSGSIPREPVQRYGTDDALVPVDRRLDLWRRRVSRETSTGARERRVSGSEGGFATLGDPPREPRAGGRKERSDARIDPCE